MKLRDHYDWIVLGNHPGALVSASLASRLGLAVLLLPFGPSRVYRQSDTSQVFDPESNYLLGAGQELVERCLYFNSKVPSSGLLRNLNQSPLQVLTPERRLVLDAGESLTEGLPEDLNEELCREFGKDLSRQIGLAQYLSGVESDLRSFWIALPEVLTRELPKAEKKGPKTLKDIKKNLLGLRKALSSRTTKSKDFSGSKLSWVSSRHRASDLAQRLATPDFLQTCAGLYSGLTTSESDDPKLFKLLQLISLSRDGGAFPGGIDNYRSLLIQRAVELGAHAPPKAECKRVFIEENRFIGVQVEGEGKMISAGAGILGCSTSRVHSQAVNPTHAWDPAGSWSWPWSRKKAQSQPIGWRFSLALTLHREAIPEKLKSRAIWKEKGAPALEIEVADPADYGVTDRDNRMMYLRTKMDFTPETLEPDYQKRIAARMFRQAMELFPFLEFHVTRIYPDFRKGFATQGTWFGVEVPETAGTSTENELARTYAFSSLEAIPDHLLLFVGEGIGYTTGVEKLFAASDESYPELGSLGGTLAALEAATWLAHGLGLPGPLGPVRAASNSGSPPKSV